MVSLVFSECPSNAQYDAFVSAARRWSTIIEGTVIESTIVANAAASDICPFLVSSFVFGPNDELDHLLIFAEPIAIDGPGGVLAAAGPCAVSDGFFPVVGGMQFDTDDLEGLEDDGTLEDVILHEMGHVSCCLSPSHVIQSNLSLLVDLGAWNRNTMVPCSARWWSSRLSDPNLIAGCSFLW